ncbi:glycosyl transferase family 1 [Mycobacterium sp. 852002-50816_SCH5313054-b]|uniref:glycosyltransferase family 4 protein n=1 Tax=Mycobacterium sp. 852002-50816_SCH5313054-b TaxID=1834092 RepID=UPI000801E1BF|nr:glycosyltransferase family 1 protein [Mycobacterium sp. 852002-50816_SCH5313054-b]OBF52866.1 glycosyl transferase family 1 [Mycobacterium sp. 852002-50816_SCH5313054-b]
MKVAFDYQIFSSQRYGGISRYFFELARRLTAQGVSEVSIVAPLHVNNYLTADSARRFTRGRHVPYTFGDIPRVAGVVNRFVAPMALRRVNPDIVHETYYALKPVGRARRRIVTVYDMIHELFPDEFPDAVQATAAKRAAVNRADHVICISENTRRDLVRLFGVDPARTSVVHLGYSVEVEAPGEQEPANRPTLLYVGNRYGYKNFTTLLQAFASSPILRRFDLVAFGGQPVLPDERDVIERLGITERVRFASGPDRELARCYRSATAFIYPSKYEGFGIPPLEAMSYGCPVVCSDAGPIPEIVGDAGAYFDPNSDEDLRTTLERVVTSEELQADLRVRGHARLAAFSWDDCAAATAQIYRDVM